MRAAASQPAASLGRPAPGRLVVVAVAALVLATAGGTGRETGRRIPALSAAAAALTGTAVVVLTAGL